MAFPVPHLISNPKYIVTCTSAVTIVFRGRLEWNRR
jgi:hypothetical protein